MVMSRSEAGKLGAAKANPLQRQEVMVVIKDDKDIKKVKAIKAGFP